ncbi:hypothetical protein ERJ99_035275, partial [Pseudomonas aeruginosa]
SDPNFWSVYASLGQRLTDDDGLLLFSAKARAVVQHLAGDQFSAAVAPLAERRCGPSLAGAGPR